VFAKIDLLELLAARPDSDQDVEIISNVGVKGWTGCHPRIIRPHLSMKVSFRLGDFTFLVQQRSQWILLLDCSQFLGTQTGIS
jgi:hypothetical protein